MTSRQNFWIDVWKAWCSFTFDGPLFRQKVLNQTIWWNSNILIKGKPILLKNWFNAGIKKINDLVNEQGEFLLVEQLKYKYQVKLPFTEVIGIQKAIPFQWMKWVRDNIDGPPFKEWYETLSKSQKKIRTVFWNLNHDENLFFSIVNRWNKCDLDQINITSEDLLQNVVRMYKITNHPKTR